MSEEHLIQSADSAAHALNEGSQSALLTPEASVILLTWVTFFIVLFILYKLAWKPILSNLEERENYIRHSLQEADLAHEELMKVNEKCKELIAEADHKAKEVVAGSRKAAHEAAKVIEEKAREEVQILLQNAQREIKAQVEKTEAQLRQTSANIAVGLAEKLIKESLDQDKSRKLVDEFIRKI